ncbi:MAG: penicillin-binding protein 2 [Candidatus Doudnabacteria bacterium]|nr:penicillin-binding protein 2 [Candidatus Doudnabacteria bacterium]
MRTRFVILQIFFVIFSAAVIMRLFSLQVLSHKDYKELAENQHQLYKTLIPIRGEIFIKENKNGKLVAVVTNIDKDLVYAVPPEIAEKEKVAATLAPILEMKKAEILERISDDSRKWVAIKKELSESVAIKIRDLKLTGVYLQPETYRLYPENDFASQVLGFLAYRENQRVGQYGVEEYFEEKLAGKAGSLLVDKDLRGRWIASGVRQIKEAEDGANVILTIDRAVQFKAQSILESTVKLYQADSGSMVVLSPKTGAVLAMANSPSFDPNNFSKVEDLAVFRNGAISDAYEPGSVFKPITMAAGLDAEAITPDMTYEDAGFVVFDEFTIRNANDRVYGTQTMTQVLEQSINTGAIFAVNQAGDRKFLDTVERFGFGRSTGITLPAEVPGDIKNLRGGGEVHYATASFGQGITVTSLQLAQAFGAIANQGKMMRPRILESVEYADGRLEMLGAEEAGQVISAKAANTLSAMLVSVVEKGHGKRAGVPGYYIAGKTGTAQMARLDGPGYDPERTIGTFAGFGPVEDPAFVIVVKIVNPKTVRFAESTAAPAFGELARYLLNYYQIPPTR